MSAHPGLPHQTAYSLLSYSPDPWHSRASTSAWIVVRSSLSKAASANFCDSSIDGTVLQGARCARKVTNLKIFNLPISQATQNRCKDLSELFNKRLCDCLNDGRKTGIGHISIKLKILGDGESTAQPWVLLQCGKDVEKRIRMLFN